MRVQAASSGPMTRSARSGSVEDSTYSITPDDASTVESIIRTVSASAPHSSFVGLGADSTGGLALDEGARAADLLCQVGVCVPQST